MAYDTNPAATHDPSVGGTPTAAWGDLINANFAYIGAAWTSFTPTWTGSGGNPAIGNGTKTGAYLQLGKTLFVRYFVKMGSTTTYGTGTWRFLLPNSLSVSTAYTQVIHAQVYDTSASAFYVGGAYIGEVSARSTEFEVGFQASGPTTPTVPITWANGDQLVIEGVLEVA